MMVKKSTAGLPADKAFLLPRKIIYRPVNGKKILETCVRNIGLISYTLFYKLNNHSMNFSVISSIGQVFNRPYFFNLIDLKNIFDF